MHVIIALIIGYLVATPLSSMISLDLTATNWTHAGTYLWIVGSAFVWLLAGRILLPIIYAAMVYRGMKRAQYEAIRRHVGRF